MDTSESIIDNNEIILKLREITPLKYLKDEDLRGILRSGKMIRYDPGEAIIQEGQYSSWIFFLITGKVGILKQGKIINVLKRQGDLFGEMGVIDASPRSASIVAIDQTVCLAIDDSYSHKLEGDDKIAFNSVIYRIFAEILSERLRKTDEELAKLKVENSSLKSELKQFQV